MFRCYLIKLIQFYRYFISPLKPKSCRFYPTCSQYAILQFKYNNIVKAFYLVILRLLKCNQFFLSDFDYPVVKIKNNKSWLLGYNIQHLDSKINILFVPKKDNYYYVVKMLF